MAKRLVKEIKTIQDDEYQEFSISVNENNYYSWNVTINGPQDTIYSDRQFHGVMNFPTDYPHSPPNFCFSTRMFHPNIYGNGQVCISILHEGSDQYGYEKDCERWSPALSAASVIISIISMLNEPNDESPANIDAARLWRNDYQKYVETVQKLV